MSYAIIRNENHKMNAVPLLERHNERLNHNYSNKDIDLSRTSENYHLKKIQAETYQWIYNKKVDKYDIIEDRKRRNKKCLQKTKNIHRNISKQ